MSNILDCIVKLEIIDNYFNKYSASGCIFRQKLIITAAHVVYNAKKVYVIYNNKKLLVNHIVKNNKFIYKKYGFYDIALCTTEDEINLETYPSMYTTNDEVGKCAEIYGFLFDKYQAIKINNIIDHEDRTVLVCKQIGLSKHLLKGFSGGGLFIDNKLAGINSMIALGNDGNFWSCHTRISLTKEWIQDTA